MIYDFIGRDGVRNIFLSRVDVLFSISAKEFGG